ncbi:MAG TPA: hypothetical protein VNF07_13075 [Acidimicrobiales bacterium]|nr:hypothetical protein [Acidimicrobiales bacterium]
MASSISRARILPSRKRPWWDVSYGKLSGLVAYQQKTTFPGRIFALDGKVVLAYLSSDLGWTSPSASDLSAAVGSEPVALRSRAGKGCVRYVAAGDGVAYSVDEQGDVLFAELFSPTTLARYEADLYEDPGVFIR